MSDSRRHGGTTDFDAAVGEALEHRLRDVDPAPLATWFSPRKLKMQRIVASSAAAIVVSGAAAAGYFGMTALQPAADGGGVRVASAPQASHAPEPAPTPPERQSPIVTVAEGTEAGAPWSLRAYSAVGRDANTRGKPQLCIDWSFGGDEAPDFNCIVGDSPAFVGPVMTSFAEGEGAAPKSALFGPIPPNTDRVVIVTASGETAEASVHRARGVAGEPTFFVGFISAAEDAVITGFDRHDAEVWTRDAEYARP